MPPSRRPPARRTCPESPVAIVKRFPVWDLPLRLFHWSLAGLVVAAVVSIEIGGEGTEWHGRFGLAILALLLFRVFWGFFGGTYARFAHCLPSPHVILTAWRVLVGAQPDRRHVHHFGHTPLGKLALMFMLGVLWLQAGTGLFANNDDDLKGPFFHLVSKARSDWLTGLHKYTIYIVGALVLLHLGAVVFYWLVKKDNLILPMLRGWRQAAKDTPAELAARGGGTPLGLTLLAASAAIVWLAVDRL